MARYVAKRIISSLFILLLVTIIAFVLVRLIPGLIDRRLREAQ